MALIRDPPERDPGGAWPYRLLVAAALLVPALLFAGVAWQDRDRVLRDAEQDAQRTVDIFRQHALSVFETHELIAARIGEHIRGMTWDEIAGAEALHRYLAKVPDDYPQVRMIKLIDASGRIRNSSRVFPVPPADVSDRDYFVELRGADRGTFIGHLVQTRVGGELSFNIARRRESETGAFDGIIALTVHPQYFADFWRRVAPDPDGISGLVRADGMLLARVPESELRVLPGAAPVRLAIEQGREGSIRGASSIDGVERLRAIRKIGTYPVYVTHGESVRTALGRWRENLVIYGMFFASAAFALALVAVLALQRAQREMRAVQERRRTEQRMQELRAELLHVSRLAAMGQIASALAHELNQPLAAASNYLGAAKRLSAGEGSKTATLVDRAGEQVLRAGEIIRRLRDFVSKRKFARNAEDIGAVLKEAAALALIDPKHRGIDVVHRVDPGVRAVLIDRIQIQQVLVNLIRNAAEAMDGRPGREITLSAAPVAPGRVEVGVADTGPGMPEDVAGRLFRPFVTTKPDGMGVGLSICRTIVEAHGGHIRAERNPEGGTVFRFTLEASAPQPAIA